jgi:methylamine dehydrogenase accessory protein MauD
MAVASAGECVVMDALIVSNVLLWVLVCVLSLVVVALTRQVGLLHERVAPVGALAVERGPAVGEFAPEIAVENLDGRSIRIGGPNEAEQRTLLFFLSPTCPVCATLLPTLRRMVDPVGAMTRLIYASDGPRAEHETFCKEKEIPTEDYVLSRDLGLRFEVSKLPYAVLIDASGTIRAKGLVNTREHVESLFEAERLGVASLQEYLESESQAKDTITLEQGAA